MSYSETMVFYEHLKSVDEFRKTKIYNNIWLQIKKYCLDHICKSKPIDDIVDNFIITERDNKIIIFLTIIYTNMTDYQNMWVSIPIDQFLKEKIDCKYLEHGWWNEY